MWDTTAKAFAQKLYVCGTYSMKSLSREAPQLRYWLKRPGMEHMYA